MEALNDVYPIAGAFFLGFTLGIIVSLRLMNLIFASSQKMLRRHSKPPLDQSGPVTVTYRQTTEAPRPDGPEQP